MCKLFKSVIFIKDTMIQVKRGNCAGRKHKKKRLEEIRAVYICK